MSYISAEEILPKELIETIQQCVNGKTMLYLNKRLRRMRDWRRYQFLIRLFFMFRKYSLPNNVCRKYYMDRLAVCKERAE